MGGCFVAVLGWWRVNWDVLLSWHIRNIAVLMYALFCRDLIASIDCDVLCVVLVFEIRGEVNSGVEKWRSSYCSWVKCRLVKVSGFCLFVPGCLQQVGWVEGELGEAALCDTQSVIPKAGRSGSCVHTSSLCWSWCGNGECEGGMGLCVHTPISVCLASGLIWTTLLSLSPAWPCSCPHLCLFPHFWAVCGFLGVSGQRECPWHEQLPRVWRGGTLAWWAPSLAVPQRFSP